jgi:rhodanese-related sulfurtransferase
VADAQLPWEVTVDAVAAALHSGEAVELIDVRTPEELAIASIPAALHIPMDQVPTELQRIEALAESKRLILICHHGVRSLNVAAWLRRQGVDNCQSMAGGIDLWSLAIDPKVPRY